MHTAFTFLVSHKEKAKYIYMSKLIWIHSSSFFFGLMVKKNKMKNYMSNISHKSCASNFNTSIRKIFSNTLSVWRKQVWVEFSAVVIIL